MPKPNEVLLRLHSVTAPVSLGVVVLDRNDAKLKEQHQQLGLLPGRKIFETVLPQDGPWSFSQLLRNLEQESYSLLNMNIERRTMPNSRMKPVLSLSFGLAGECTCTPSQVAWIAEYFCTSGFRLVQGYLNPRRGGARQLALDCCQHSKATPEHIQLPIRWMIGTQVIGNRQASLV